MDNVNKTLYIPLYGKAYVSRKNVILKDKKAEEIWDSVDFELKGKAKSKWLAYYMAMRSAFYDAWVKRQLEMCPEAVVLHVGCGLDSRVYRVSSGYKCWYDIDFPEVIAERRRFYAESEVYRMISADMRTDLWKESIKANQDAIIVIEGVSMYFKPEELVGMLSKFAGHFKSVHILMDCYTQKAAKVSKYKNPINEVGVTVVYGYDDPEELAKKAGLKFIKEYDMTPKAYIDELQGMEKTIFKNLFGGNISKSMYRMYDFSGNY